MEIRWGSFPFWVQKCEIFMEWGRYPKYANEKGGGDDDVASGNGPCVMTQRQRCPPFHFQKLKA